MATYEEISAFRKAHGGSSENMQLETFFMFSAVVQTLAALTNHFNNLNPGNEFPIKTLGDMFALADSYVDNPEDIDIIELMVSVSDSAGVAEDDAVSIDTIVVSVSVSDSVGVAEDDTVSTT